jgi:hypothetical protein
MPITTGEDEFEKELVTFGDIVSSPQYLENCAEAEKNVPWLE